MSDLAERNRARAKPLTDHEKAQIISLRKSGATIDQIAKEIHRTKSRICVFLRAHRMPSNADRMTAADIARARELRAAGKTHKEIGKILGRARSTISELFCKRRIRHLDPFIADSVVYVPEDRLVEREHRLGLMPRDLTAMLCGDPLPGYSALERR